MLELKRLSGNTAGTKWSARRFPVRIGRSNQAEVRLEEQGVWDKHALIDLRPGDGFVLKAEPDALVSLNTHPTREALLKNGDIIQLGGARLQFWLTPMKQRGLAPREWLAWAGIIVITLGQVGLVYWLLR
jgi:pSer/pThr/pTyr-binding forkhead associated (FHA) protein